MKETIFHWKHTEAHLRNILDKCNPKSILLVTGRNSYKSCGAEKIVSSGLEKYSFIRFYDFAVNPKFEDVLKGIQVSKAHSCDFVIAVGGGSVIDVAKSIIGLRDAVNPYEAVLNNHPSNETLPLLVMPTTAGTGSEATHFAVIYVDGKKYSLAGEGILPDYVLLEPSFTYGLSHKISVETGLDALSHAIEAYWSINSTRESDKYAKKAIEVLWHNLYKLRVADADIRDNIAYGAYLAGKAINIAKTTAPHALSYTLTSQKGLSHGHAVALFLPLFFQYNADIGADDCIDPRGPDFVKKKISALSVLLGAESPESIPKVISRYISNLGLDKPSSLAELSRRELDNIFAAANPERLKNNPRRVASEKLKRLLNL